MTSRTDAEKQPDLEVGRTRRWPFSTCWPFGLSRVPCSQDFLDSHATVMMRLRSNSIGLSQPSWL